MSLLFWARSKIRPSTQTSKHLLLLQINPFVCKKHSSLITSRALSHTTKSSSKSWLITLLLRWRVGWVHLLRVFDATNLWWQKICIQRHTCIVPHLLLIAVFLSCYTGGSCPAGPSWWFAAHYWPFFRLNRQIHHIRRSGVQHWYGWVPRGINRSELQGTDFGAYIPFDWKLCELHLQWELFDIAHMIISGASIDIWHHVPE